MDTLLGIALTLTSVFLILVVLVQRGRGGGLAGALGGAGGQSAFGAKAGDMFTKITVVVASVWILLCVLSVKIMGGAEDPLDKGLGTGGTPTQMEQAADGPGQPGAAGGSTPGANPPAESGETPAGQDGE